MVNSEHAGVGRHLREASAAAHGETAAAHLHIAGQVAGAQQTLAFLNRTAAQLGEIRDALTARLMARFGTADSADTLATQIARFDMHWQRRHAATSGRLDARLGYSENGSSRQVFRIRGLDGAGAAGKPETLAFHLSGRMTPFVVRLDARMPAHVQAERLSEALSPLMISAACDASGHVAFSTPEARWPKLARSLSIAGGGIRFPSGRPSSIQVEPDEGIIVPRNWHADSPDALRETLTHVATALNGVARVQRTLRGTLDRARRKVTDALTDANRLPHGLSQPSSAARLVVPGGRERFAGLTVAARIEPRHVRALLSLPASERPLRDG
ncbi:hypothetical protein WL42_12770 [Burkholderia ubonensis]|nr:hypothetical protein WL42_12770 [Burkholderia ubonensis]